MAPFSLLCTIHGLSGPLLFTLYYSLWKISRKQDFLHRGPPTLNVGQQIYCFLLFTIYYLERRARIPCIAGMSTRGTARMAPFSLLCTIHGLSGPLLFTLYYSRWKISRKQDFLHRGPPTLNVGQQTYRFFAIYYLLFTIYYLLFTIYYLLFTIYYLLFRTESESSLHRGQPTQRNSQNGPLLFTLYYSRPEWPPSIYSVLFPMENLPKARFFASRATNPECRPADLLFFAIYYLLFTIYYLLFRTESENSLHRGQPTQRNSQNGPLLFTLYYSRPEWPPSIYSVLFPMENLPKARFFASRATNPECRPADLLFFAIYYLLFRTESENSLHRGHEHQRQLVA